LRSIPAKNAAASLAKPSDVSDSLSPGLCLSTDFAGSYLMVFFGREGAGGVHDHVGDHTRLIVTGFDQESHRVPKPPLSGLARNQHAWDVGFPRLNRSVS
jgi:hypothetical protein